MIRANVLDGPKGKWVSFLLVTVLYLSVSLLKIHHTHNLPQYDSNDGNCFFWTESAFHYRYAEIVAEGEQIPKLDSKIQHPDTTDVYSHFTIFMEVVSGGLYKWVSRLFKIPFHAFLVYFNCFFSSISVIALYLVAREVWDDRLSGVVSAGFYAFTASSYVRTIMGTYIREDFSLPFIFLGIYFFVRSITTKKVSYQALAGACMFVSLASWHVTQFYFLLFMLFVSVAHLLRHENHALLKSVRTTMIFAALAGIMVPALRTKHFLISYPMLTGYSLLLSSWVTTYRKLSAAKRYGTFVALLVLFALLALFWRSKNLSEFSHVYELLVYKLRFLNVKPDRAALLPIEARLMWTGPFNAPIPRDAILRLAATLFAGLWGTALLIADLSKRKITVGGGLILYLLLIFSALWILVARLEVFLVFFLAVAIGRVLIARRFLAKKSIYTCCVSAILLPCLLFQVYQAATLRPADPGRPVKQVKALVDWIKGSTGRHESFLSEFSLGSTICTYADRPVILHSKFENVGLRKRVIEVLSAAFQSEADLFRVCKIYQADYFVYHVGLLFETNKDSKRYATDNLRLKKMSCIYKFHFEPEKLEHFTLVYQNSCYRVFRVEKEGKRDQSVKCPYHPFYDKNLFRNEQESAEFFDDSQAQDMLTRLQTVKELYETAIQYHSEKKYDESVRNLEKILELIPQDIKTLCCLAVVHRDAGHGDQAIERLRETLEIHPGLIPVRMQLAEIYADSKLFSLAAEQWKAVLEIDPGNRAAAEGLRRMNR